MNRAEKIEKRKARAQRRRAKRNEEYFQRIRTASELGSCVPLCAVTKWGVLGSWPDPSSPTGYSQKCDYDMWGTCQSPCNGDC